MMKPNHSQKPKKKSHKFRNAMLAILFMTLVGAVSVIVTWAVTNATDFGSVINEFTNTSAISVEMVEDTFDRDLAENYDALSIIEKVPKVKNTSAEITATAESSHDEWVAIKAVYTITLPKTVYDEVIHYEEWQGGSVIQDNTLLTVDNEEDRWTFPYESYDYFAAALAKVSNTAPVLATDSDDTSGYDDEHEPDGFNTEYWEAYNSANDLFIYKSTVSPNEITEPLFHYVCVNNLKKEATRENVHYYPNYAPLFSISLDGAYYYNDEPRKVWAYGLLENNPYPYYNPVVRVGSLPTFDIKLTAYAVQADGVTFAEAKEALYDLAFA